MNDMNWDIPAESEFPDLTENKEKLQETRAETVSPMVQVLTIDESRKALAGRFSEAVDNLVRQAGAIKVTDSDSAKQATELGAVASKLKKAISAKILELIEEPAKQVKAIKGYGETFTTRLDLVYNAIVKKLTEYNSWLELERRKQEEVAKKAQAQFQQQLDEEAKAAGVEAPIAVTTIIPEQKTNIKTEGGSTAFTGGRWKCTVTDENRVPREYCSPDSKKLNAAVKAGLREIPGCEIKKDEKVRIRT